MQLADIKSAKVKRNDWVLQDKIQWVVYSWLRWKNDTFTYYVFIKNKPRLQVIKKDIRGKNLEKMIVRWLKIYIEALEKNRRTNTWKYVKKSLTNK
jgi:hypothetical protein